MTLRDVTRAYHFAAQRHVDQRRKGAAAEPYINHLTELAELLAGALGDEDSEIVVAGVLHDTIKDTATTPVELTTLFGERVAALVAEVTDDKRLPKGERKRLQVEHAAHASRGAKLIKLADKAANLRALTRSPPLGWDLDRRTGYVEWARQVAAGCTGINAALEQTFEEAASELDAKLRFGTEASNPNRS